MRFIAEHKADPFIDSMIVDGLKEFISVHVCCFSDSAKVPVHFIGSIGYFFEDQLRRAAAETGVELGVIIRKPIDSLVQYHIDKMELKI